MKKFLLRNKKTHTVLLLLILISISCIPLIGLLHPGLPITHDGQDHVARIANFYQNLQEGIVIPRWAPNLNWGYGHPILMFLYPIPSYSSSFFHFLGFSLVDSLKIVFAVTFVASGITMFLWVRSFLDEYSAFFAALLYMFAPYRLVDLYVRGAIGEHVAFVFPPLILYFLFNYAKQRNYLSFLGAAVSLALLILSHNAISLMFVPLLFAYSLFLLWGSKDNKNFVLSVIFIFLLGFGLSAFFWVPAFVEGKYTLRDIVTKGEYAKRFVEIKDFFMGPWNYGGTGQFTVQIGILQWCAVFASLPVIIYLKKHKNKYWGFTLFLVICFLFSLFIMTSWSVALWDRISMIQKFQFPWRFLSLTVFITAVLGGIVIHQISGRMRGGIVVVLALLVLYFSNSYWHANGYLQKPSGFYTGIYQGTTDTGESAPIWSVRFMEQEPQALMEVIEGDAQIRQLSRSATKHLYEITATKTARIRENTLYFPGWAVNINMQEVPIEFQDPKNRGLITFFVEAGTNIASVEFSDTKLRFFASIISIVSILVLGIGIIISINHKIWKRFL